MAPVTAAEHEIREIIAREGRITFREFMELALYTAPGSYYGSTGERIGAGGDYFTSPSVHPSFGALVARQIEQVWICLGRPDRFDLVEAGAGTGALARDILAYATRYAPDFRQSLAYVLLDVRDPGPRAHEAPHPDPLRGGEGEVEMEGGSRAQRLAGFGVSPKIITSADPLAYLPENSLEGCILSNELLDAFPVHRVTVVGGRLQEAYVEVRDGKVTETPGDISTTRLATYFETLGFLPPEGCWAEVNLAAKDWIARVAGKIRRGAVLTLDYGLPASELYSRRFQAGTLLCFFRHTLNGDPYARIGQQDITAHVDYTTLQSSGAESGLKSLGLTTQQPFLEALGFASFLAHLRDMTLPAIEYDENRAGMLELIKPEGLGRIRVLLQHKGLNEFSALGLRIPARDTPDLGRDLSVEDPPLMDRSHVRLTSLPEADPGMDNEGMWHELFGGSDR